MRNFFEFAAPVFPIISCFVFPMLPIAVCPIIRVALPQRWNLTRQLTVAFIAICAVALVLLLSSQDGHVSWFAATCFGLALGLLAGHIAGERERFRQQFNKYAEFCAVNTRPVVLLAAAIAGALVLWQLLGNLIYARVFGISIGLPGYMHAGVSTGARIIALLQMLDACIGGWAVARFTNKLGVPRAPAVFAAACWFVASGRIAPQVMGFQPTCLVPLAALYWRAAASRGTVCCGALGVVFSLVAPQLVVPSCIAVFADYARLRDAEEKVSIFIGATAALIVIALIKIALFPAYPHIVGDAADSIVRYNGGDGSYPWEWLLPGATQLSAGATLSVQTAAGHLGNIWERCASVAPAAVLLAFAAMFDILRGDSSLRRFCIAGIGVSVWAALPSHVFGTPLPDPTLVLWLLHAAASTGAFSGLAGVFVIAVLGAAELASLLRRNSFNYSAIAYAAAVLLVVLAPIWNGLSWRPGDTALASQLRAAASRCNGTISMVPGTSTVTPVGQYNNLIIEAGLNDATVRRRFTGGTFEDVARGDLQGQCAVVAFSESREYVVGPLATASVLPPSMMPPPNASFRQDFQTLGLSGWNIESIADDDSVFYVRR